MITNKTRISKGKRMGLGRSRIKNVTITPTPSAPVVIDEHYGTIRWEDPEYDEYVPEIDDPDGGPPIQPEVKPTMYTVQYELADEYYAMEAIPELTQAFGRVKAKAANDDDFIPFWIMYDTVRMDPDHPGLDFIVNRVTQVKGMNGVTWDGIVNYKGTAYDMGTKAGARDLIMARGNDILQNMWTGFADYMIAKQAVFHASPTAIENIVQAYKGAH